MSQQNSGKISIANIIAIIGLAALGVITFFGALFKSADGKPSGAILGAVALVAGLGFLLFMSIRAKTAEDNPDKWRYAEWASLALYVVVAVVFAFPFQRFFYVVSQKEAMQNQARTEIAAIKKLYQQYEQKRSEFLSLADEQIKNYKDSPQPGSANDDAALAQYVSGIGEQKSWLGNATTLTKLPEDKQLKDLESKIISWNLMKIPSIASELEQKVNTTWTSVTDRIKKNETTHKLIPIIGGNLTDGYHFDGYVQPEQYELGEQPKAEFASMLKTVKGQSVLGWIIYVVLHLLVLLNYFVASRSGIVGPTNRSGQTGGLDL